MDFLPTREAARTVRGPRPHPRLLRVHWVRIFHQVVAFIPPHRPPHLLREDVVETLRPINDKNYLKKDVNQTMSPCYQVLPCIYRQRRSRASGEVKALRRSCDMSAPMNIQVSMLAATKSSPRPESCVEGLLKTHWGLGTTESRNNSLVVSPRSPRSYVLRVCVAGFVSLFARRGVCRPASGFAQTNLFNTKNSDMSVSNQKGITDTIRLTRS